MWSGWGTGADTKRRPPQTRRQTQRAEARRDLENADDADVAMPALLSTTGTVERFKAWTTCWRPSGPGQPAEIRTRKEDFIVAPNLSKSTRTTILYNLRFFSNKTPGINRRGKIHSVFLYRTIFIRIKAQNFQIY